MNDYTKFFQQPNENVKEEPREQSEAMKKLLERIPRTKPWPPDCNKCEDLEKLQAEIARLKAERDGYKELYESRSVPANTPQIVCLCGSTRFMDAFHEAGWHFTLKGYIVLSVGVCKHAEDHGGEALGQEVADRLDELHLRKIDLADLVYVLNVDGYIGESTGKEVEYAKKLDKPIQYLEQPKEQGE